MKKSVEVKKLTVPVAAVGALNDQERHFYYLTGLIYKEICCLRKLISYSVPAHSDHRPFRREAEFSQTFFLMRIAGAKVHEAWQKLNGRDMQAVLRADVFPQWPDGAHALKSFNRKVSAAKWLANLRNTIAFHYPTLDDWKAVITPNSNWHDDVLYFGSEPGNMYFDAPEQQVRELMFGPGSGTNPDQRMDDVVSGMVEITTELGDFVERAQVHFAMSRLLEDQQPTVVGSVIAPPLDDVELPFWTTPALRRKKRRPAASRGTA